MDPSKPIIFYDIGPTTYAANTWKTRYALNFKRVQYKTEWVDMPDVASVRKRLDVPQTAPSSTGPHSTPPHSPGPLHGRDRRRLVRQRALLDRTYTEATHTPSLFPPSTIALQRAWNKQSMNLCPIRLLMRRGIPLNPETAEITKASFVFRSQKEKWEDFHLSADERTKHLHSPRRRSAGWLRFTAMQRSLLRRGEPYICRSDRGRLACIL
ncbi:hypothetical protein BJ912DRAFT_391922 [Pholiota molesta]|nr:hypothetical protein BJ912DRAFT_391922 [Pholiota molesta]